ncbi:hypothetical protein KKI19_04100 [Patescibacteria group bacterium]|nr:hypothetical protein [Patescibacteria group bacterium]
MQFYIKPQLFYYIKQGKLTMTTEQETLVGSLLNKGNRNCAAGLITGGEVVGVFNRGVNALWIDGGNQEAVLKLQTIKGELRQNRPVALTIGFERLVNLIDTNALTDEAKQFLDISGNLKSELGSLCFLRVPLKTEYIVRVPASSLNYEGGRVWIQSWDPYGHRWTEQFLRSIEGLGVEFPAVTSMNISGEPEIVDQDEGEEFCREHGIPLYLRDPRANSLLKGSYTIITLSERGIELTRDGNIPGRVIEKIIRSPLVTEGVRRSRYPQLEFPDSMFEGLSPKGVRIAALLYLTGKNPGSITGVLKRYRSFVE